MKYPLSTLLIIAIWTVCLIPVPETPLSDISFIDKWTHFVMYGTLTITLWGEYWWRHRKNDSFSFPPYQFTLYPILMGGLIELAQKYLTTCRSGEFFDFVCNTLGVLLGAAMSAAAYRLLRKKKA